MPALHTPVTKLLRSSRWGIGGCLAACLLLGCASSTVAPESIPGSAAEAEVHRLAKTRLQLAALHFEEGRTEIALGEVAQSLQAYPRYVDAFNLRGWIALSLKDYQLANESFVQALALRPGDAETLYNLAWLQCQQKNYVLAEQNFAASLEGKLTTPQPQARTWVARGMCLREAGQLQQAWKAFEKAYEIEPGNAVVAYNFAQALYAQGQAERARFYTQRLNNGARATAQSLWLGIKVERTLGDRVAVRQLADQLHRRFPDSKEWQRFEQGAFDD